VPEGVGPRAFDSPQAINGFVCGRGRVVRSLVWFSFAVVVVSFVRWFGFRLRSFVVFRLIARGLSWNSSGAISVRGG